jgi:hypothetical protein
MGQLLATHTSLLDPNTMPNHRSSPHVRARELLKNSKLESHGFIRNLGGYARCTQEHTLVVVHISLKPKPQHGLDLMVRR